MNYYNRHIGDYMKDASHLSLLEHGVYVRLMDVVYSTELPIPEGQENRLVGARTKEEKQAVESVLKEFFSKVDQGWSQKRCFTEIENYRRKSDVNRENGFKGGRPKNPDGLPKKTERLSLGSENKTQKNPYPRTNNQEPITNTHTVNKDMVPEPVLVAVIKELATLTGKPFDPSAKYCSGLNARIAEGVSLEVLLGVVRHKHRQWGTDPKMRAYLTPDTLFRPANFEKYALEISSTGTFKEPETEMQRATREVLESLNA